MSPFSLTVLSRRISFETLHASDLDGPKTRQRVLVQNRAVPSWLSSHAPRLGPGQTLIAVSTGKARTGARIRVQSVVVFSPPGRAPFACVYVEESTGTESLARTAAPVQVVRCEALPESVRFVEVSARVAPPSHLRPI